MQPLTVHRKASTRNLCGAQLIVLVLTCAAAAELLVGTTICAAPDMENVATCLCLCHLGKKTCSVGCHLAAPLIDPGTAGHGCLLPLLGQACWLTSLYYKTLQQATTVLRDFPTTVILNYWQSSSSTGTELNKDQIQEGEVQQINLRILILLMQSENPDYLMLQLCSLRVSPIFFQVFAVSVYPSLVSHLFGFCSYFHQHFTMLTSNLACNKVDYMKDIRLIL